MRYIAIFLGICFAETRLKNHVEDNWDLGKIHTPPTDSPAAGLPVRLRRCHNHGAFLNLGEHHKKGVLLLSLFFTLALSLLFLVTLFQKGKGLLKTGLSFLLGGAFSNTYDRLRRGYVVDYFSLQSPFPRLNSIVFNLADFAILIGSLMITASEMCK